MDPTPVNLPSDVVEAIMKLKFTEILELEKIGIEKAPTLNFGDSLIVATENDLTLRVTVDQLMQYLNENLRNFIMWKPVVTDKTLIWERSNDDTQPDSLDWSDIIFPIVSDTENGMMTTELYKKLRGIDDENIVYKSALDTAIATRAPKEHTHEQYLLATNLPKVLSAFENDTKYITLQDVPKNISHFTNDAKYVRYKDIPLANIETNGLMSAEMFNSINLMLDTFMNSDEFQKKVDEILKAISELKLSSFENDAGYLTSETLHEAFAPMGAVNLVVNSDFHHVTYPEGHVMHWVCSSGDIERIGTGGHNDTYAHVRMDASSSLTGYLVSSISDYATISFYMRGIFEEGSSSTALMQVTLAGVTHDFEISDGVWNRFTFIVKNDYTTGASELVFTNPGISEIVFEVSNVKVENGKLASEYFPSYYDIINSYKYPATTTQLGSIRPDGNTLTIDSMGVLSVVKNSETGAAFIDDNTASDSTVYSSARTEQLMIKHFARIDENGIILTKHLPSFVDDIVEGEMTLDADGNFVFVSDTAIFDEPSKGKIYLDTATNASYRWSGSEYIRCSTDMLGGEVLVKYDQTDKYMYFVFPEE